VEAEALSVFAIAFEQAQQLRPLEAVSVLFAVLYLALAIRENVWCWPAAFLSSVLLVVVAFDARLFAQVPLNAFYAAMAV
jgi:nicotinamide mononucleotide transporter